MPLEKKVKWPVLGKLRCFLKGHDSPAEIKKDFIFIVAQRVAGEGMTSLEMRLQNNLIKLYRNSSSATNRQTASHLINQMTKKIESTIIEIAKPLPKRPLRKDPRKRAVIANI